MAEATKSDDIGMRRGRVIANLPQANQLDVIAEGLPVLMKSIEDLYEAAVSLSTYRRSAAVLEGHAAEETAKILILMDIVRCPSKFRSARIGVMMGWFYDHLARLIYFEAQNWKPVNVSQLQKYVDDHRKSHYLEGSVGEYIMPNMTIYLRESLLYADVTAQEDGEPTWNDPCHYKSFFGVNASLQWKICQALRDMGAFTREGLNIVSSVWDQIDFVDTQDWSSTKRLTYEMLLALKEARLISDGATDQQVDLLYDSWQLPMYCIDFKRIDVPLEVLKAEREANLWSEMNG